MPEETACGGMMTVIGGRALTAELVVPRPRPCSSVNAAEEIVVSNALDATGPV